MNKGIIAVDVDEVCADLLSEWLRRYNLFRGLTGTARLLPEQITDWDITAFVRPEDRKRIYEILREKDLYDSIQPIEGARAAVWELRQMGYRVIFVTACVPGTSEAKQAWLNAWGFFGNGGNPDKDFCPVTDKSLIRADILVDDRIENVREFRGQGVLVTRAHNRHHHGIWRIGGLSELPAVLGGSIPSSGAF